MPDCLLLRHKIIQRLRGSLLLEPHLHDWVLVKEDKPVFRLKHLRFDLPCTLARLISQLACDIIYHTSFNKLLYGCAFAQESDHVGVVICVVFPNISFPLGIHNELRLIQVLRAFFLSHNFLLLLLN